MCGRFKAGFEFRDIRIRWNVLNDLYYNAGHNIAPTQEHPIIVQRGDGLEARPMRWGLVPHWAKDQAIGNKMINARSETLAERPAFLLRKGKTAAISGSGPGSKTRRRKYSLSETKRNR
jgi:putative SOS response-associated peptidase YedK